MAVKTLTIDGKLVSAREDETILEAAREAGASIPTLCHLEGVSAVGACRLCLVEVGNAGKLQAACVTTVAEDMEIHTDTPRLRDYSGWLVRHGRLPSKRKTTGDPTSVARRGWPGQAAFPFCPNATYT
jgi:bidirectional [NiFe] hydrogenase diaphorase subunit